MQSYYFLSNKPRIGKQITSCRLNKDILMTHTLSNFPGISCAFIPYKQLCGKVAAFPRSVIG